MLASTANWTCSTSRCHTCPPRGRVCFLTWTNVYYWRTLVSRAQLLEWCRDNSVVWENPVRENTTHYTVEYTCKTVLVVSYHVLQFTYFIMVSFSFLSYAVLNCSLVCIPTTGYILLSFWVHWTLLLSNSNPRRSFSLTTGRDDTDWLILAYAYHWTA